jgi:RNA polymerase sigma factor (sigma-70 family)
MNAKNDRRASDQKAWVLAALDQFEPKLLRYAQRLLGSLDEARDVVQFVFLRLCDQSPADLDDRLAPWLYTVCRNRALDLLRSNNHVGWAVPITARNTFDAHRPPYTREPDPALSAEQSELHDLLTTLAETLPDNQREALDLWSDGFSYLEISRITNKQEGHIRVLVHRGLKTLREHPQVQALMDDECGRRVGCAHHENLEIDEGHSAAAERRPTGSRGL